MDNCHNVIPDKVAELATELARLLGITHTGSFEVHCRDGVAREIKLGKTLNLSKK